MQITQSWFYKISDFYIQEDIIIHWNIEVILFDDICHSLNIVVSENTQLYCFGFLNSSLVWKDQKIEKNIIHLKQKSASQVNYLLLWNDDNKISVSIHSHLQSDETKTDVAILSFVKNHGFIDLDGVVEIDKKLQKCEWHLEEKNIFLWNSGKMKWVPRLLIASSDIQASHSCKMERISNEKIFYLRSRWIQKQTALDLLIESYIRELFLKLKQDEEKFYDSKIQEILSLI